MPLSRTFTNQDVIIANSTSKSILRAVCGELAAKWDGLDYFPSYESVMLTRSWDVLQSDLIHVTDEFVGKIVAQLARYYMPGAGAAEEAFRQSLAPGADPATALAAARRAVELAPGTIDYRLRLATLLTAAGALDEADLLLRAAYRERSDLFRARELVIALANAHAAAGG